MASEQAEMLLDEVSDYGIPTADLRRLIESLEADAARLDFLEKRKLDLHWVGTGSCWLHSGPRTSNGNGGLTVRAAIDAALGAEQTHAD